MVAAKEIMVGIDMGGTSLRALVVNEQNEILAIEKTPTNVAQKPEGLDSRPGGDDGRRGAVGRLAQIAVACRQHRCAGRGRSGARSGVSRAQPGLGRGAAGAELKKLLHVPVFVENDVNVGVAGEHALGAGQGAQELVGIFVGTGIGGGIISRGELYLGMRGAAAEVGHMIVQVDGPLCGCGNHGCIEALASRTAMERDVRAAIHAGQKSCVLKLMEERGKTA